jgi:hypothetical protein
MYRLIVLFSQDHDALLRLWKNWPNPSSGLEYQEFKKSQIGKETTPANVLKYTVNLDDASSHKSTHAHHHGKKTSRKDVEELLANFLNRQTQARIPGPPEKNSPLASPSSKKNRKKNKKHKKKHRKAKKHGHDGHKNGQEPVESDENGEDSHEDEDESSDDENGVEVITEGAAAGAGSSGIHGAPAHDKNAPEGTANMEVSAAAEALCSLQLDEAHEASVDPKPELETSEPISAAEKEVIETFTKADVEVVAGIDHALEVVESLSHVADSTASTEKSSSLVVDTTKEEEIVPATDSPSEPETSVEATVAQSSSSKAKAELTYRIVGGKKTCTLPAHRIQAGCTAVVALLVGDQIITANAGRVFDLVILSNLTVV